MPDAQVIPFPSAATQQLRLALARLHDAQTGQAEAVARLRNSLDALRTEAARLGASVQDWHRTVGAASVQADGARAAARDLLATASRM